MMHSTSRVFAAVLSVGLMTQVGIANAMDDMKKGTTGNEAMSEGPMKKGAAAGDCPDHAAMGKDAMAPGKHAMAPGKDAPGKDAMGKDAMGKDAMATGKDGTAMGNDGMNADSMGHAASSNATMKKDAAHDCMDDAMKEHATGKDAMKDDAMGKDAMKK